MTRFRISGGIEELLNNITKSNSNKTLNRVQGDSNKSILPFSNTGENSFFEFFLKSNFTKKNSKIFIDNALKKRILMTYTRKYISSEVN